MKYNEEQRKKMFEKEQKRAEYLANLLKKDSEENYDNKLMLRDYFKDNSEEMNINNNENNNENNNVNKNNNMSVPINNTDIPAKK